MADDYRATAREAAARHGVPGAMFERQINQESGFNPRAYNSASGAAGIAQIIARFHPGVDPFDPIASLEYAAKWLAELRQQHGSWRRALAAYNWGPGNVSTWDGRDASLPAETRRYLDAILGPGWPEPDAATPGGPKLSEVLARGRSRIGDPYVWDGETPGRFDCSGFVKWCYSGELTSFTDAIFDETVRVETPAPGDIVLYEYKDPDQPNTRFPHVGLFLSDATTLDARAGKGVGEHPQLPRAQATRYYRRFPGAIVDTVGQPAPSPAPSDPRDARISGLETALAHLADVTIVNAAAGAAQREQALVEARKIREQFLGPAA